MHVRKGLIDYPEFQGSPPCPGVLSTCVGCLCGGDVGKSPCVWAQVICVAEGAGQEAMEKTLGTDASGNPILADVGIFLRDKLKSAIKVRVPLCARHAPHLGGGL